MATSPIASTLDPQDPDVAELLNQFVHGNLPKLVQEINSFFNAKQKTELKSAAHRLKGVGGGYGFPMLTTVCAHIETEAGAEDWSRLAALVEELNQYFEGIKLAMP